MDTLKRIFSKRNRAYLYGLGLASFPVLVHYGVVEPQAAPLFLGFLLALLHLKDDEQV